MSLLVTQGQSLNDESLGTLFAETETILNSRLLTIEALGDVKSEQPICLINKTILVMTPYGELVRAVC